MIDPVHSLKEIGLLPERPYQNRTRAVHLLRTTRQTTDAVLLRKPA